MMMISLRASVVYDSLFVSDRVVVDGVIDDVIS